MNRRAFLQRLGAVAAAAGVVSALPTAASAAVEVTAPDAISTPAPETSVRRAVPGIWGFDRAETLRAHLLQMSRLGDDTFRSGDREVLWRWEQVRTTVIGAYASGSKLDAQWCAKRMIALPAVADALFVAGEPGHTEWQQVRLPMYALANRAFDDPEVSA